MSTSTVTTTCGSLHALVALLFTLFVHEHTYINKFSSVCQRRPSCKSLSRLPAPSITLITKVMFRFYIWYAHPTSKCGNKHTSMDNFCVMGKAHP